MPMLSDALTTPIIGDLMVLAFFANEAVRRRRQWSPPPHADRDTLVFRGCYAIALLALNVPIASKITAASPVEWIGVMAAACGLAARVSATPAARHVSGALLRADAAQSQTDLLGSVVFWIGATIASGNLIAALTVSIATLAAAGVHMSTLANGRKRSADARLEGR